MSCLHEINGSLSVKDTGNFPSSSSSIRHSHHTWECPVSSVDPSVQPRAVPLLSLLDQAKVQLQQMGRVKIQSWCQRSTSFLGNQPANTSSNINKQTFVNGLVLIAHLYEYLIHRRSSCLSAAAQKPVFLLSGLQCESASASLSCFTFITLAWAMRK